MNKQTETALKMAIEALENCIDYNYHGQPLDEEDIDAQNAINACKQALELQKNYEIDHAKAMEVGLEQPDTMTVKELRQRLKAGEKWTLAEHTMTYEQGFAHGYEAHRAETALAKMADNAREIGLDDD